MVGARLCRTVTTLQTPPKNVSRLTLDSLEVIAEKIFFCIFGGFFEKKEYFWIDFGMILDLQSLQNRPK